MWEEDTCDFLAVTEGLGRLQALTRRLCAGMERSARPTGRSVLLMPCPGETHIYGLSILASFFRESGWEVTNLGHSAADPAELLGEGWYDINGLSLSCDVCAPALQALIPALRRASRNPSLFVLVGGPYFARTGADPAAFGADAYAPMRGLPRPCGSGAGQTDVDLLIGRQFDALRHKSVTPRPRPAEPVLNEALPKVAALLGGNAAGLAVTAASDLSLIVDADGVIQGASGAADFAEEKIGGWLGRRLVDTVTVESRTKVDELLRDAGPGEITRWRQVNHPSPTGIDLPIRYTALRPDADGPILVLGRDMRTVAALQRRLADTQQTLERDYDRLRAAETRYRLLFQICGEAVLVVDSTTRRVIEANPAAAGSSAARCVGSWASMWWNCSIRRACARSKRSTAPFAPPGRPPIFALPCPRAGAK